MRVCLKESPLDSHLGHQEGRAHLEEGDDVLKVVQLQDVGLALGHHGQRHAQQHVRLRLLQQHVDDAAGELGREGAGEARQEPLRCIQHRQGCVLLHERNPWSENTYVHGGVSAMHRLCVCPLAFPQFSEHAKSDGLLTRSLRRTRDK